MLLYSNSLVQNLTKSRCQIDAMATRFHFLQKNTRLRKAYSLQQVYDSIIVQSKLLGLILFFSRLVNCFKA